MTIQAGIWNITIEQGATFNYTVTLYDSSTPPQPIDLTGYTAKMMGRTSNINLPAPFFTLTTENGGLTLGGTDGTITILIEASTTANFYQNGVYDLIINSPNNVETDRVLQGSVTISPRVTI